LPSALQDSHARKVRVAVIDTATGSRRELSTPFADLPALIAGLDATEALAPAHSDDESDADVGGILILEAHAVPKVADTFADLHDTVTIPLSLALAPLIGVPFYSPDGRFKSTRYVVGLDDNDPAETEAIGTSLTERSTLIGARLWLDHEGVPYIGGWVRVVGSVPAAPGAAWFGGASFLSYGEDCVSPLTAEEQFMLNEARAARWPEIATDYERVASMLGSAEPAFFAATRDLSGPAVWDMMARLQRAAVHPDPLAEFVRTKVIPLARQYRDDATDRARFDTLLAGRLRHDKEYAVLPPAETARVLLTAWLFAAPASLFVGKGAATIGPLIVPGKGEPQKTTWLVDGWMPSIGLGALVGDSGAGKSQIAADLAARVATLPTGGAAHCFAGRTTGGAQSVLYFGSEGVQGWTARAERQITHVSGRPVTEPHGLCIADGVPPLSSPIAALACVRDAIDAMRRSGKEGPALIVIDVLRAAMTGNEDNSGDMDLACSTAWAIARMCGCFVLLIHHARKNSEGGNVVARGSGALRANLDFEATVRKDGGSYRLTVTKNRNGAEGDTFSWHIPALDAPLYEGEGLRPTSDERKVGEQAAEIAGRVIRERATPARGITTREFNDALLSARPDLFKPDGKRDGSRLQRARETAIRAGYIAEGKAGKWVVGEKKPPEPEAPISFDLSVRPESLGDLVA
jgi:hypothetical protein